ncbi:MAG: helix-turn-helix domain-containing protein [Candidatus Pristimantibacillus sp.]
MKFELGACLLNDRLLERGMTQNELALAIHYKPERLTDYMDNKRIMPLKVAVSIAATIGCTVNELYELEPY